MKSYMWLSIALNHETNVIKVYPLDIYVYEVVNANSEIICRIITQSMLPCEFMTCLIVHILATRAPVTKIPSMTYTSLRK